MTTELEQLVEGCKRKNPLAQKKLYELYAPKMLGLCMRYTHSRDEAQDLLHDGIIKVFENIEKLTNPLALESWMGQIMTRLCINYLKRRKQLQYYDLNAMDEYLPEEEPDDREDDTPYSMEQIINAIQSLPPYYRLVFNMFEVDEMDIKAIAKELKQNESTVRSSLTRARNILKKKLKNRIPTV